MNKTGWRGLGGFFLNLALAAFVLVVSLFLADRTLSMLGLPAPAQVNPPHLDEVRKNIEFQYPFKTNSLGFRYREIPLQKPEGTFRVYLAGDSFTEGMGLAPEETFGAILEKRYSRPGREVHFINGGLAGAGPREYGDVFLKIGLKYRPDGLLICLYPNDLSDTKPPAWRNPLKRRLYLWLCRFFPNLGDVWTRFKNPPRPQPSPTEARDLVKRVLGEAKGMGLDPERIEEWRSRLPMDLVAAADRGEFEGGHLAVGLLNPRRWTDSLDIDTAVAESKWRTMIDMLSRVVDECRRRRIQVAFVYMSCEFQYLPSFHEADSSWVVTGTRVRREWLSEETELQRRCEAWAKEKNIPYLDMTPALRRAVSEGRSLNYPIDGHWNAEGDRVAAAVIGDWLDRERVFGFLDEGARDS